MKILYVLKSEPDETVKKLIETQRAGNEIKVLELYSGFSAAELLEDVEKAEKVICW